MPPARPLLLLSLALAGCTDRPLETTESSSTPGTTDAPPASSTDAPGTADPSPTTGTATTAPLPTTESPATTDGPATTTAVDPGDTTTTTTGTGTTTGEPVEPKPWPAGLVGCYLDAPAGTDMAGDSDFGPFVAQRAYFDWYGSLEYAVPLLLFVSPGADPAVEVELRLGTTGQIYLTQVAADSLVHEGWLGTWPHANMVYLDSMGTHPPSGTVTITELAGNWDAVDPDDPPRLVGTVENGAISGPFNAVFCNKVGDDVFPE